jgi:hypothetical protein
MIEPCCTGCLNPIAKCSCLLMEDLPLKVAMAEGKADSFFKQLKFERKANQSLTEEINDLCAQLTAKEAELDTQKRFTEGYLQIMRAWEKENGELQAENAMLREVLERYEKWEADLLLDGWAWEDGLPRFTQELYDKWIEIQEKRNQALSTPSPAADHYTKMQAVVEATKKHVQTRTTEDFLAVVDALRELEELGGGGDEV